MNKILVDDITLVDNTGKVTTHYKYWGLKVHIIQSCFFVNVLWSYRHGRWEETQEDVRQELETLTRMYFTTGKS